MKRKRSTKVIKETRPTMKSISRTSSPHLKTVEWSDEDRCFVGRCPGLFYGGCHGSDKIKVFKKLCMLVQEHVTELLAKNRPHSVIVKRRVTVTNSQVANRINK